MPKFSIIELQSRDEKKGWIIVGCSSRVDREIIAVLNSHIDYKTALSIAETIAKSLGIAEVSEKKPFVYSLDSAAQKSN